MSDEWTDEEYAEFLEELEKERSRGTVLIFSSVGCSVLGGVLLMALLVRAKGPVAAWTGILCWIALGILSAVLMYRGMAATCRARGQPRGWAIAGLVVALLGAGIWAVLIVALLPDRYREDRERFQTGPRLYKPSLYSIIIGIPMPYIGLPMSVIALDKIIQSEGQWKGLGYAIAGIITSLASAVLICMALSNSS